MAPASSAPRRKTKDARVIAYLQVVTGDRGALQSVKCQVD